MLSGYGVVQVTDRAGAVVEVPLVAGNVFWINDAADEEDFTVRPVELGAMSLFELSETYNYSQYLMEVGTVTPEMLEQLPQLIDIRQAERDAIRAAQAAALAVYQAMEPAFIADIAHDIMKADAAGHELAYWQINPNVRLTTVSHHWVINASNELIFPDMRPGAITDHWVFWGYARGIMRNGWFVGQDWSVWSSREEWVQVTEVALAGGEVVSINRVIDIYQEHVTLTDGTIWRLRDSPLVHANAPANTIAISLVNGLSPPLLAAAPSLSVALTDDGGIWYWGTNFHRTVTPTRIAHINGARAIFGSFGTFLVLDIDGVLWQFGNFFMGGPSPWDIPLSGIDLTPRRVMDHVVDVWVSDTHAAALRADGSLWTWGGNYFARIGDGTRNEYVWDFRDLSVDNNRHEPVRIMDNVVAIAGYHSPLASEIDYEVSIALLSDGTLWAWGFNFIQWGQGADPNAGLRPELFMSGIMVP